MAEARETMTEMDQPEARDEDDQDDKRGRRLFGRPRDRSPRELRSETEWVDTLVAHQETETPVPPPFAVPSTDPSPFAGLEDTPDTEPDAYYGSMDHEWRRRQNESMDTIHQFIDNVIGTENEPRRRMHRRAIEYGLQRTVHKQGRQVSSVAVEGLDKELLIAFTFPHDEFRGARVVYETEGGYVVEVRRAIDGRDDQITTQHYTVSRVGEVGHVLDKLRASDNRPARIEPPAPRARPAVPMEPLPEPPAPEPVQSEPAAPPPPAPLPPPEAPPAIAEPEPQPAPNDEAPEEKRGFGFLRRKNKDDAPDAEPDAEAGEGDVEGESKGRFAGLTGRFRRKGKEDDDTAPEM